MPLSCKGRYRDTEPSRGDIDDALGNFSLTLVDTLDTLVILHKEELGVSETEHHLMQRVEQFVSHQKKRSSEKTEQDIDESSPKTSPAKSVPQRDTPTPPPADIFVCPTNIFASRSSPPAPSKNKFVRVVTSDGCQSQLHLDSEHITFTKLQEWIRMEFHIPPPRQRIKHGFPPRELHPPGDGERDQGITLSHGERMMVEIMPEITEEKIDTALSLSWYCLV